HLLLFSSPTLIFSSSTESFRCSPSVSSLFSPLHSSSPPLFLSSPMKSAKDQAILPLKDQEKEPRLKLFWMLSLRDRASRDQEGKGVELNRWKEVESQ
ncbi:hypothetical protein PENTCL1PPCAC_17491, partial [Pristionchus entomophagus]